jgi:cobalt-zinc-cadmium efflux system membrane fusion protein
MKQIVSFLFFFILIAGSFQGCKAKVVTDEDVNQPFSLTDTMFNSLQMEPAEMEVLHNELKFYGKITADNNKLVEVYPVVGGSVINVYAELGDYVDKGKLLATIRSTEVAGFAKELQDAENEVIVAANNLKVAQELFEGKLSAEREVIVAKSELEKAKSQLSRIKEIYQVYNLKGNSIYEVRAPLSGFIIEKKINKDMLLRSDRTDNLFDIAQINDVWAIANVNESDISQVKLGEKAEVLTLSYPDQPFMGHVDKIYNMIDPETKAMQVRIKISNNDYRLKPDMRATVKLSFDEKESMLSIPSKAIIFDKSKNFVMVYNDRSHVDTREVTVFRQLGDLTYISSGLHQGEKVITKGQLLIYDALND